VSIQTCGIADMIADPNANCRDARITTDATARMSNMRDVTREILNSSDRSSPTVGRLSAHHLSVA